MSDELGIVTAGVPQIDGCRILTRAKAFVVDQGSAPVLEHTFRNRQTGTPVDISSVFGTGGDSLSNPAGWTGTIRVRVKEALSVGPSDASNAIWEMKAVPHAPMSGIVRVGVDPRVTAESGIFFMSWGVEDGGGRMLLVNNTLLSVERSLFAPDITTVERWQGPMTLMELRTALRDSEANENLRLDDVEFSDDEILLAILSPIEYYNEQPPPLRPLATTKCFPWRYHWKLGTIARLYAMAANWYRRNKQQLHAGGLSDDDLNRDQAYDAQAQQMWKEYRDWVQLKKVELNAMLFSGAIGSQFDRGGY